MAAPMKPGRRLRLDRRKAGLDQEGLARQLGVDVDTVSKMERDLVPLTDKAKEFSANVPARVPTGPRPATPKPEGPQKPGEEPGLPSVEEEAEGLGPRVEHSDAAPKPGRTPKPSMALAPPGEIAELERALLKMFAGEAFLIPRTDPEGNVTQVEAIIPGVAQAVGMFDEFDGMIIRTYAPGMAKAWAELARVNPTVRKVLTGLTYGGAYRGVVAATLPAALAIMAHHGMLPQLGGGGPPVVDHPPAAPPPAPEPQHAPGFPLEPLVEVDLGG